MTLYALLSTLTTAQAEAKVIEAEHCLKNGLLGGVLSQPGIPENPPAQDEKHGPVPLQ